MGTCSQELPRDFEAKKTGWVPAPISWSAGVDQVGIGHGELLQAKTGHFESGLEGQIGADPVIVGSGGASLLADNGEESDHEEHQGGDGGDAEDQGETRAGRFFSFEGEEVSVGGEQGHHPLERSSVPKNPGSFQSPGSRETAGGLVIGETKGRSRGHPAKFPRDLRAEAAWSAIPSFLLDNSTAAFGRRGGGCRIEPR